MMFYEIWKLHGYYVRILKKIELCVCVCLEYNCFFSFQKCFIRYEFSVSTAFCIVTYNNKIWLCKSHVNSISWPLAHSDLTFNKIIKGRNINTLRFLYNCYFFYSWNMKSHMFNLRLQQIIRSFLIRFSFLFVSGVPIKIMSIFVQCNIIKKKPILREVNNSLKM